MSDETSERHEDREPPEPRSTDAARAETHETEAVRIRSDHVLEPDDIARDAGLPRFRNEAERIRADRLAEPGVGAGTGEYVHETEAVRIRSDEVEEPEGIARDAGLPRFRNEAERIRSDGIAEPRD